ncbi:MAG: AI-2E family transporter [Sarcina sp.]
MKKISKNLRNKLIFIAIIMSIAYGFYKFKFIREILYVIILAFIFAYALKPIRNKILEKVEINKKLLSVLLIVGVFLGILSIFIFLIPNVLSESLNINNLILSLESFLKDIISKCNLPTEEILDVINNNLGTKLSAILGNLPEYIFQCVIEFSDNFIAFAIVPIVAYYFLSDGDFILNKLLLLFNINQRVLINKVIQDIDLVLSKYILGQFLLCGLVGLLSFLGLWIIDIKFILLLSILNGILNIVPYFGAFIGAIPAILIALIDSPIKFIYCVILFLIIQQIEGNILAPKITANSVKMHPLMVIILLLIGERVGGLMGMVMIVPIGVIIKIIYEDIDYYLF